MTYQEINKELDNLSKVMNKEDKKEIEKLRKKVQWWFQRHIKGEYTIFQIKRKINDLIKEFGEK